MIANGVTDHAIGSTYFPAPQGTLMATLAKGILSYNLDWQFVLVGVFIAITMELCGIKSLSFAVGAYLPLSTTLPIFIGGAIRGIVDKKRKKDNVNISAEEEELGKGNLFATGLVAGGAVAGVIIAIMAGVDAFSIFGLTIDLPGWLNAVNLENALSHSIGEGTYFILGAAFFALMGWTLYKIAIKPQTAE
jgi:hypothetical protein